MAEPISPPSTLTDELFELIQRMNGIWTYPNGDDNNRRLYEACVTLEEARRVTRRDLGDGAVLFVAGAK